jgi:hypothetical protein
MAITFASPLAATGEDKTLEFTCIDRANFGEPVVTPKPNGDQETMYKYVDGNPARPSTLRVGHYMPTANRPALSDSAKLRTVGVKTDNEGVETEFPIEVTLAVVDGSLGQLSRADIAALIMQVVSVMIEPAGVLNEVSTSALTRLSFGETSILGTTFA